MQRYTAAITVKITPEHLERLQRVGAADDRAPSTVARRLLADALDRIENPKEVAAT